MKRETHVIQQNITNQVQKKKKKDILLKSRTFCFPSNAFRRRSEFFPSENNASPRSSKCARSSAGGISDEGVCLTHIKS